MNNQEIVLRVLHENQQINTDNPINEIQVKNNYSISLRNDLFKKMINDSKANGKPGFSRNLKLNKYKLDT